MRVLLWLILLVICWPLALVVLILYPLRGSSRFPSACSASPWMRCSMFQGIDPAARESPWRREIGLPGGYFFSS